MSETSSKLNSTFILLFFLANRTHSFFQLFILLCKDKWFSEDQFQAQGHRKWNLNWFKPVISLQLPNQWVYIWMYDAVLIKGIWKEDWWDCGQAFLSIKQESGFCCIWVRCLKLIQPYCHKHKAKSDTKSWLHRKMEETWILDDVIDLLTLKLSPSWSQTYLSFLLKENNKCPY